jgi:hypothetical protein
MSLLNGFVLSSMIPGGGITALVLLPIVVAEGLCRRAILVGAGIAL